MIKFFRKIRQNLIIENKTGKYFKYAIGEIFLVVIGILIALQINNWNEKVKKEEKIQILLNDVLNELHQNITSSVDKLPYFHEKDSVYRAIMFKKVTKEVYLNEKYRQFKYMMNDARIGGGLGATSLAYTGYLHALAYAKDRKQGRNLDQKDPSSPMVAIIQHSDVKRMLIQQKSYAEGGLALGLYCAQLIDLQRIAKQAGDADGLKQHTLLLDILTPIAKSWPSEYGLRANEQAIQVHGGYGYTRDYPVERFYRDNRLNHIHEGTKGIQGLDLLGRKVTQYEGASAKLLFTEMMHSITQAQPIVGLSDYASTLKKHLDLLMQTTQTMQQKIPSKGIATYLANATLYLDAFGHVVVAWMWLNQAIKATEATKLTDIDSEQAFYQSKISTCHYFYQYELPNIIEPLKLLSGLDSSCIEFDERWF